MTRRLSRAATGAAFLALTWVSLTPSPVGAQDDPASLAARAEQAAGDGKTLEALDLARQFYLAVRESAPLAFRKAELVDKEPTEFGSETPRSDNVYDEDEEIHLYVEPVAFGWKKTDSGWESDMVADVRVSSPDGKIIVAHKAFSEFHVAARERDDDVFLTLTYVFGGLGSGDYVVTTTLRDRIENKSAAVSTPITIR